MSKWNRETIITDHGKDFISNIPKLDDFICIPDNLNYERIIGNFYNTYNELPFKPVEEKVDIDSPKIEKSILFKNIFLEINFSWDRLSKNPSRTPYSISTNTLFSK
jgi:hypothetical protein